MTRGKAPMEQPTPPRPPVTIKGRGDGLRITIDDAEPAVVEDALRTQLARRANAFFADAPVRLEMPAGPLDLVLAGRLALVIEEAGMRLTAVETHDHPAPNRAPAPSGGMAPTAPAVPPEAAMIVSGTVRSGQRVAHEGAVVVLGDVNPGAEVIAGGSVIVWGHLRGTVEAGLAEGADSAIVCALNLAPTQLRIGEALARAPEEPGRTPEPEIARQVDGRIEVDGWR